VPSLLLRDKRDFAATGALIISGVVGARSWIWHQTLISASPPYSSDCRVHVPSWALSGSSSEPIGRAQQLILKRASASRPSGEWSEDDYDVLADDAAWSV
jgi:hypothetical protein